MNKTKDTPAYETLKKCPLCEHQKFKLFLETNDFTVTQETFRIWQCESCGFVFTNPRPDEAHIGRYYQSEAYISHSDTRKGIINTLYHWVRQRALKKKLRLINRLHQSAEPSPRLLDYGCGTGAFLETARQGGWDIEGVEPDEGARQLATKKTNKPIQRDLFDAYFDDRRFDIITLWHVLEHVHALHPTVDRLKTLLKPRGVLVVAVPNYQSYDARFYGKHWAAYDVPRHLYHFSVETIKHLAHRHQLHLAEYLPMYYDAYYVSLLSEKYRHRSARYVSAFQRGWQSNQKAGQATRQYSSLIYILKPSDDIASGSTT